MVLPWPSAQSGESFGESFGEGQNSNANVAKDFRLFQERVFATLSFQFANLFNHVALTDPYLDPSDFGVLGSNNINGGQLHNPRQITFNLRIKF